MLRARVRQQLGGGRACVLAGIQAEDVQLLLKHPRKLGASLEQYKFSLFISYFSDPNMSAWLDSLRNAALGIFGRFSYSKNVFCWSS